MITGSGYARYVLLLLTLINLFNYLDRYIIFSLFPLIKAELSPSDFQLGMLETVVELMLALAVVPMGIAADVGSRKKIISAGLFLWSLSTALGGLVRSYWQLFACRTLIGIGESSYAPSATALIVEHTPVNMRGRAIGFFSAGMGIGGMLGYVLGGIIAHYLGWRYALFIVGVPGLLLTLAVWRLKEIARRLPGPEDAGWRAMAWITLKNGIRQVIQTPTLIIIFIGATCIIFAVNGLMAWGATYLNRYLGISVAQAGFIGATGLVGVVAGNITGGFLGDRLLQFSRSGRLIVVTIGFVLGAPFCLYAVTTDNQNALIPAFIFALFLFTWYNGPLTATIFDVSPYELRATVMACYNGCIHLFGAALAPSLIGRISDSYGLDTAIVILPVVALAGGLIVFIATITIKRDMEKISPIPSVLPGETG